MAKSNAAEEYPLVPDKNFGLTFQKLEQLLADIDKGNTNLYTIIHNKMQDRITNLLKQKFAISTDDAYDIFMGTFLTFIERLKAAKIKYGNMEGYFWLMVKNRTIAFLKRKNIKIEPSYFEAIDEYFEIPIDASDELSIWEIFETVWKSFGNPCKDILHKFFFKKIQLKIIAQEYNMNEDAMRQKKLRCLKKLREEIGRFLH